MTQPTTNAFEQLDAPKPVPTPSKRSCPPSRKRTTASSKAAELLDVITDTREQKAWPLSPRCRVTRAKLDAGDYSVSGFEQDIAIERKGSLTELAGNLTHDRPRFLRAVARLAERRWACVIVEGSLSDLLAGNYRSRANPSSLLGSIAAIIADGVPVYFAADRASAAELAERLLLKFADRARRARAAGQANAELFRGASSDGELFQHDTDRHHHSTAANGDRAA